MGVKSFNYIEINPLSKDPRGTLIFFHGLGEHPKRYFEWGHEISKHCNIFVILITIPGHGMMLESPNQIRGEIGKVKDLRNQVNLIIKEKLEIYNNQKEHQIFLGGFSMGGIIASWIALRSKINAKVSLISIGTPYGMGKKPRVYDYFKILFYYILNIKAQIKAPIEIKDLISDLRLIKEFKNDKYLHSQTTAKTIINIILMNMEIIYFKLASNIDSYFAYGENDKIIDRKITNYVKKRIIKNNGSVHEFIVPNSLHCVLIDLNKNILISDIKSWIMKKI